MEPTGPILKKTFVTVGVMLAAWVAFIGTVSIVAVLVTSRAVGAPDTPSDESAKTAPASPDKTETVTPRGAMKSGNNGPQRI